MTDRNRQTDRSLWMNADVSYPGSPSVSFTGFDPEVGVNAGKAEAVNRAQAQAGAIAQLVTAVARPAA